MSDVVKLVVDRYDGALKAEHGTGRNMAPFVETEWGPEAYVVMKRLKQLCDPEGLLNPGVIINSDPKAHLTGLKPLPPVEEEVDKCIECGYCESKCPSRELTTTPRQRIVLRREIARLKATGQDRELLADLEASFPYSVLETCAADGLCATACPVSIDTGQLTRRLRKLSHSDKAHRRARWVAEHFRWFEVGIWLALHMGHLAQSVIGAGAMNVLARMVGAPGWSSDVPLPARAPPKTQRQGAQAIYFPSCISRAMGRLRDEPNDMSLMAVIVELAARAAAPVYIPADAAGVCCGVPFSSKGFDEAHKVAVNRAIERFWSWSQQGKLSVFVDTSPCTYGLLAARPYLTPENQRRYDGLRIVDAIEFMQGRVLSKLAVTKKTNSVALHPVCSVMKLDLAPKLEAIARACSADVLVPINAGCCGFAGDRGFLVPELTASATRREAAEVKENEYDGYFSSSRTCEIGMTRATGHVYRSFVYLLEQATRPALR
jgi:D-lactate dehydrogenase